MAQLCELLIGCRRPLGDGELMRELRALQRAHFHPPPDEEGAPARVAPGRRLNSC